MKTNGGVLRILREDDPQHELLVRRGWTIAHRSWGAHLTLPDHADLTALVEAVAAAQDAGYAVRPFRACDVGAVEALDAAIGPDFPATPASHHEPVPRDLAAGLADGSRTGFLATDDCGQVAAYTWMDRLPDRWEVDRTAVAAAHRRRGLATAVKAASILATYAAGARRWGTGGAGVNAGSLAMNLALGFELEPQWHTLAPPPDQQQGGAGP